MTEPRPTRLPTWAEDATFVAPLTDWDGEPTKLEPLAGQKASGHVPDEPIDAQIVNHEQCMMARWIRHLSNVQLRNWQPRGGLAGVSPTITTVNVLAYDEHNGWPQILLLGTSPSAAAPALSTNDGQHWVSIGSGITGTNFGWRAGMYVSGDGIDRWIIVGDDGAVASRVRGLNIGAGSWTMHGAGVPLADLKGIAHGPGEAHPVVVVGDAVGFGTVATCSAGMVWSIRSIPLTTPALTCCAWGNGTYVALGISGACISSTDGITWTARTVPGTPGDFRSVTFSSGRFCALDDSRQIYLSPDGITWTLSVTAPLFGWVGTPSARLAQGDANTVIAYESVPQPITGIALVGWLSVDGGATWGERHTFVEVDDFGTVPGVVAWAGSAGWIAAGPISGSGPEVFYQSVRL